MPQHGGPAVLHERDERDVRLSDDLRAALREWAEVADIVLRSGDAHELDLLRRRGRQLAARAADVLGRPVEFVDPVSGVAESIRVTAASNGAGAPNGAGSKGLAASNGLAASDGAASNRAVAAEGWVASKGSIGSNGAASNGAASNGAASNGAASNGAVASNGPAASNGSATTNGAASNSAASHGLTRVQGATDRAVSPQPLALEPPGPTPWGTGMAVAAFFAVLVAVADVVLAGAFGDAFGLLWIPANLLVTAGTMPSLWLAREVPFWRWPAFGAAAGLAVAWIVMLLGLLG